MKNVKLNNGVEMPILGYGVYQVEPAECERCVTDALNLGYRLIDTAQAYHNEQNVGDAIHKSGIPRQDIFLTTKVWISNAGEEQAMKSIDESLRKLQTDYVDLLLIHQPFGDYYGTYRAMEKALMEGKTRAIGVSNFFADRFVDLAENVDVKPMVNQMETHVFFQQKPLRKVLAQYNCQLMSWAPFAEGKNNLFANPILTLVANQHGKSTAQVALRYWIQQEVVTIPKTVQVKRMRQNMDIFDFELTPEEMSLLATMDTNHTLFSQHNDADFVHFLLTLK